MSVAFLQSAISSVNWGLALQYGLQAATLALSTWVSRSCVAKKSVAAIVPPTTEVRPSIPSRKTKKKVTFAEGKEVREFERWQDPKVHQHRRGPYWAKVGRTVAFALKPQVEYVDNWIPYLDEDFIFVDDDGDVIMSG